VYILAKMDRSTGDRDSFPSTDPSSSSRSDDFPTGGSNGRQRNLMRGASLSPNEMAAAKAVVDRHIENGDITREDVALIQGTTRTASVASTVSPISRLFQRALLQTSEPFDPIVPQAACHFRTNLYSTTFSSFA